MTDRTKIEELVQQELAEANKLHPMFHSPHEAFGVLLEEAREHGKEKEKIEYAMDILLEEMMNDEDATGTYKIIKKYAINASAEAIQVAAMCQKALDSNLNGTDIDELRKSVKEKQIVY